MYDYQLLAEAILVFLFMVFLACPICAAVIARAKGRDTAGWFVMGLVFGPFGLIAAAGLPKLESYSARRALRGLSGDMKLCDFCIEPVRVEASVCRHCSSVLVEESA